MLVETLPDGYLIQADSTHPDTIALIRSLVGSVPLIHTDPPYGNIVTEYWDKTNASQSEFAAWLTDWTKKYAEILDEGGAFFAWGGIGKPGFRPFLQYILNIEADGCLNLSNLITWSKKRAYGVSHNYLFTREELAYFVKGDIKKPKIFNIPLLDEKRGYAGYNKKYPAKSEYYRRTNVWMDITEMFRGKIHPTQKPSKLAEITILAHTNPGDWVLDPFAGSGFVGEAARNCGRKFILIEQDPGHFERMRRKFVDGVAEMGKIEEPLEAKIERLDGIGG